MILNQNKSAGRHFITGREWNQISRIVQHPQVDGEEQPPSGYTQYFETYPENFPFLCIIDGANDAGNKCRIGPYRGDTNYFVKDLIVFSDSSGTAILNKTTAETATATADGYFYYDIDGSPGSGSIAASDCTFSFSTSIPTSSGTTVKYVVAYAKWDSTNSRIEALEQLQYGPINVSVC